MYECSVDLQKRPLACVAWDPPIRYIRNKFDFQIFVRNRLSEMPRLKTATSMYQRRSYCSCLVQYESGETNSKNPGGSVTTDARSVADPRGGLNRTWAPTVNIQIISVNCFGQKRTRRYRFPSVVSLFITVRARNNL